MSLCCCGVTLAREHFISSVVRVLFMEIGVKADPREEIVTIAQIKSDNEYSMFKFCEDS